MMVEGPSTTDEGRVSRKACWARRRMRFKKRLLQISRMRTRKVRSTNEVILDVHCAADLYDRVVGQMYDNIRYKVRQSVDNWRNAKDSKPRTRSAGASDVNCQFSFCFLLYKHTHILKLHPLSQMLIERRINCLQMRRCCNICDYPAEYCLSRSLYTLSLRALHLHSRSCSAIRFLYPRILF